MKRIRILEINLHKLIENLGVDVNQIFSLEIDKKGFISIHDILSEEVYD